MTAQRGPITGIYCDYPRCAERTAQFSDDFSPHPTAPGWETWRGSRRRMDYCPEHAARPKAKTMRRMFPADLPLEGEKP